MNEVNLTVKIAKYLCMYDSVISKAMQAIFEASDLINRTRKDNDEPDIQAIKKELESKYKWEFNYKEGEYNGEKNIQQN